MRIIRFCNDTKGVKLERKQEHRVMMQYSKYGSILLQIRKLNHFKIIKHDFYRVIHWAHSEL